MQATEPQDIERWLYAPVRQLTGPEDVDEWLASLERLAKFEGCYQFIFDRQAREITKKFDDLSTYGGLLADQLKCQAYDILHSTVSGKVWAYMRVMGFSEFASDPFLAREFAVRAAEALPEAERHMQDREEIGRMLHEWRCAEEKNYLSPERYQEAKTWLNEQLRWYYDRGHPEVRRFMDAESRTEMVTTRPNDDSRADEAPSATIHDVKQEQAQN